MSTLAIIGIAFGSLLGGSLMKKGRRMTIIASNIACIAICLLSFIKVFWVICLSRFLYGFFSGIIVAAAPKWLDETIPTHLIDKGFGASTNLAVNIAIMILMVLGTVSPDIKDIKSLNESNFWRVVYGFPIISSLVSLIMILTIHKQDSLLFLMEHNEN